MATAEAVEIRPQPGPQERALASQADIVIYGGAAGGGKTWSLLLEPLRHIQNPKFGAVIFRRICPNITNEGGMWDESRDLYSTLNGKPNESDLSWQFPSRAKVRFAHCQYLKDVLNWKGAQIPLLAFDQLEEFEEGQFWYLVSRNRSMCGVKPYIRATVNPVPVDDPTGGWVHRLIQWWIDEETGLPIPARDGVLRWFVRAHDELVWDESADALRIRYPELPPKSLTFIAAKLEDNRKLMEADPDYLANLLALPMVERERLYGGNWNSRPLAGKVFNRMWFHLLAAVPSGVIQRARHWDLAATEGGGDWTVGVKMASLTDGRYLVEDVVRIRYSVAKRDALILQTAQLDGPSVAIGLEEEGGSAGKSQSASLIRLLAGFNVRPIRPTGSKLVRARPFAAQAEAGNVLVLTAPWTEAYLTELHNFIGDDGQVDDQVDSSSGAFAQVAVGRLDLLGEAEPVQPSNDEATSTLAQRVKEAGAVFPGDW